MTPSSAYRHFRVFWWRRVLRCWSLGVCTKHIEKIQ